MRTRINDAGRSRSCIARWGRQDGHGLRGIVGIQVDPHPVLAVRGVAGGLGGDHRLDVGGLKDLLETQGHAGGKGTGGGAPPPRVEPRGSWLFAGWLFRVPVRFDSSMIAAFSGAQSSVPSVQWRLDNHASGRYRSRAELFARCQREQKSH